MQILKQSTASQAIKLGVFVDDTDAKTAETALTIANTDIQISKAGGTFAAKNSGGGTHDADGWYTATLDATDTATVGTLDIQVTVSGALPVQARFQVVEEAIYASLFASAAASIATEAKQDTIDTNVDAILVDTGTTIPAQVTALNDFDPASDTVANVTLTATATTVTNQVTANTTAISGSTTAADNLEASALGIHKTTVATSASATEFTLTAGSTVDDTYIGRIIVVTSGNNAGEATDITDYVGSTKTVTVTAFTSALTAADDIVIV